MPENPTVAALRKAIGILEDNGEALDDGTMTENEWFDMLAELRFASRQFEKASPAPAIAA